MNAYDFTFCNHRLTALPSGALWWPAVRLLCVSDLHLCKSDRIARRSGTLLPPYETRETLAKLALDIALTDPQVVLCLGDSFDDLQAAESLSPQDSATIASLQAGRRWVWLEGNHDPGPVDLGGTHLAEYKANGITFRHIASAALHEVSGHYHPKHAIPGTGGARPCFLCDGKRLILPAYGAYTGGMRADDAVFASLFDAAVLAVLTGRKAICVPVRRSARPAPAGHWPGSRR